MKSNIMKILAIATFMTFIGAGVSLADGWKNESGKRGYAHGHYKHAGYPYHRYCAPRPVYFTNYCRPVVIERRYYLTPVYYAPPAPSGFFFGMSVLEPWLGFSFGIGGR